MVLATPVLPPEKSEQAKAGRLVPGGVGGVTGGAEMRGAEALAAPVPRGVIAALGASTGPQAVRIEITSRARPARTGQWYGRGRPEVRRGGGTGRRVGLKNRCPQGRPGSTPGLGTTAVERSATPDELRSGGNIARIPYSRPSRTPILCNERPYIC